MARVASGCAAAQLRSSSGQVAPHNPTPQHRSACAADTTPDPSSTPVCHARACVCVTRACVCVACRQVVGEYANELEALVANELLSPGEAMPGGGLNALLAAGGEGGQVRARAQSERGGESPRAGCAGARLQ